MDIVGTGLVSKTLLDALQREKTATVAEIVWGSSRGRLADTLPLRVAHVVFPVLV
jgi:hypothetical protein